MAHDGYNASTAARAVGYESPSQFSREFKRLFGVTPVEEAEQMPGSTHGELKPLGALPSESESRRVLRRQAWPGRARRQLLGHDLVLGLAEDDADGRLIVGVAEQVIDRRKVKVHLAGVFRLEMCSNNPFWRARSSASLTSVRNSKLYGSFSVSLARSDCGGGSVLSKFVRALP